MRRPASNGGRTASSFLSARTAQCLIALPLALALFALSLQVGTARLLCCPSRCVGSYSVLALRVQSYKLIPLCAAVDQ